MPCILVLVVQVTAVVVLRGGGGGGDSDPKLNFEARPVHPLFLPVAWQSGFNPQLHVTLVPDMA